MPIRVHLTSMLVRHLGIEPELVSQGGTVAEVLDAIDSRHEGFRDSVCDESGRIREFVNIFVNERVLDRKPDALSTKLLDGDEIYILASVAGG